MEKPWARWILAGTWGNYVAGERQNPSPDRHTRGTHWHMRSDTLAQRTRSRTERTRSRITMTRSRTCILNGNARAERVDVTVTHPDPQVHQQKSRWTVNRRVSQLRRFTVHSSVIMPLVVGYAIEAWVSEPGTGTRTCVRVPHVPGSY